MAQILEQFAVRTREYVLLNSSDKEARPRGLGKTVIIPAFNVVGTNPARDNEGNPIPGTTVVKDMLKVDPVTGRPTGDIEWNAALGIRHILGIDPNTGEALGPWAEQGLSLVSSTEDPKEVAKVRAEGRARWEDFELAQARETVRAHKEFNQAKKRFGETELVGDLDVERAMARLNAATERAKLEAAKASGLESIKDEVINELLKDPDVLKTLADKQKRKGT
jgi:hypothetical protein